MKNSKQTITQLRKKADSAFSKYVRMRDGQKRSDGWWSVCITCDRWKPLNIMHAGHFQSRRFPATRWDEQNVNAQCAGCNMFKSGDQYRYALALDLKYGTGTAARLHKEAQGYFKVTRQFLEGVIHDSMEQIKEYEVVS